MNPNSLTLAHSKREEEQQPGVQLSVVLPAFNEQAAVSSVLAELAEVLSTAVQSFELIVVDDGSQDDTAILAERAGAIVIRRPERGGYGAAVKTGIRAAYGAWVALLDADGSYDPKALPGLLALLPAYDQASGARINECGSMAYARRPAKWLITKLAEWISGQRIMDLNSGMKVFKRGPALGYLWTLPDGFSASTSLTLAFLCDGRLVAYVPVPYRPRIGRSKFHALHDTLRYLATIGRMILYFRPLRVFLPLAAAVLLVSVPLAVWHMLYSPRGLHDADVILLSLAVLTGSFGLLAELIVAQRRADVDRG